MPAATNFCGDSYVAIVHPHVVGLLMHYAEALLEEFTVFPLQVLERPAPYYLPGIIAGCPDAVVAPLAAAQIVTVDVTQLVTDDEHFRRYR